MATKKYTRGKNGLYMTKTWDGTYNPDGSKHRINIYTKKSSRELERMVKDVQDKVARRAFVQTTDVLFIDYARQWLDVYKAQSSANTRAMYGNIINVHFRVISSVRLQDFSRLHVQMLINNAHGKPQIQNQILLTVKQVLKTAVIDKYLSSASVDDALAELPKIKYKAPEKRALTGYEKAAVFKANYKSERDRVYIYLLYGCGLRREEATALTISDFDTKKGTVTINKAFAYTYNVPTLKEPKTARGFRTVPLPKKITPTLYAYLDRLRQSGESYLFTTITGQPLTKSAYMKMWKDIVSAMQETTDEPIKNLTGHLFRHNYCSSLCYQIPQISIKHIARLMGDTEAVVMRVYNHIILEQEDAIGAINNAIS